MTIPEPGPRAGTFTSRNTTKAAHWMTIYTFSFILETWKGLFVQHTSLDEIQDKWQTMPQSAPSQESV